MCSVMSGTCRWWNLGRIWLLALLVAGGAGQAADSPPTFAEWQAACAKLPLNRILGSRQPPRELLPLSSREFDRLLETVLAGVTNGPLASTASWVGLPPAPEMFFDISRSWFTRPPLPFQPFAQKLVLPAEASVVLLGDLHGDIHSLLALLVRMQEKAWLNEFTLVGPHRHLIFLGDYTDRGKYGLEVLYTLLRLKVANPDRVHLVRGNHEDVNLVARYGFLAEVEAKFGREFNVVRLLRFYDFLPVVLYLGCGSDFVQLCHGGLEPGYQPAALLAAPGTNRVQLLGPLSQAAFLRDHPEWLKGEAVSLAAARQHLSDFTPETPTSPSVIGFMWNDFTVFTDEPAFAHNPDRALVYGQPAVRYLLNQAGGAEARVHAVIRAHQHASIPNPLMRRLMASRGLFRHWQETNSAAARIDPPATLAERLEPETDRPLPEGSVWTLNVTPDSVYGAGCRFDFATLTRLQLGSSFGDWRITAETVDVPGLR